MNKQRAKIGQLQEVVNKKRDFGEADGYLAVHVIFHGNPMQLMGTRAAFKELEEVAKRNKGDMPTLLVEE